MWVAGFLCFPWPRAAPLPSEGTGPLWSCLLFLPSFAAIPTGPPAALVFPAGSGFWLLSGPQGFLVAPWRYLSSPFLGIQTRWTGSLTWAWPLGKQLGSSIPGSAKEPRPLWAHQVLGGSGQALEAAFEQNGNGARGLWLLRSMGVGSVGGLGRVSRTELECPSPRGTSPWQSPSLGYHSGLSTLSPSMGLFAIPPRLALTLTVSPNPEHCQPPVSYPEGSMWDLRSGGDQLPTLDSLVRGLWGPDPFTIRFLSDSLLVLKWEKLYLFLFFFPLHLWLRGGFRI